MPKNKKGSENRLIKGAMMAGKALAGFFALVGRKLYTGVRFDRVAGKDDLHATEKRINNMKRIAAMIGALILVLIIIILLLRSCQGGDLPHGSIDIPGNVISPAPPETATLIELTAKDGYDNLPFAVENMLPGDSIAQYYCVSLTHDRTQTVRFYINVDEAQKLSDVLKAKVELLLPDAEDEVLYDGSIKDCTAVDVSVAANGENVTPIYYRITVYTNGAEVGNEYAGQSLTVDFSWKLQ